MGKISVLKIAFLAGIFLALLFSPVMKAHAQMGGMPWWISPTDGSNLGTYTAGQEITPITLDAFSPTGMGITYLDQNGNLASIGLSISGNQIVGAPTQAVSSYSLYIVAMDNGSMMPAGATFYIDVVSAGSNGILPVWNTPQPGETIYVSQENGLNIPLSAFEAGESPVYFSDDYVDVSNLGLQLNSNNDDTGSITGYPVATGQQAVRVVAYDQGGDSQEISFILDIAAAAPVWAEPSEGDLSGYGPFTAGTAISPIPLYAQSWSPPNTPQGLKPQSGGCPFNFSVEGKSSLPGGLSITDPAGSCNFVISGTPASAGNYSFILVAFEMATGGTALRSFSMTVDPENSGGSSSDGAGVVNNATKFAIRKFFGDAIVSGGPVPGGTSLPVATTGTVSNIMSASATVAGSASGTGITARGVAVGTSHAPTTSGRYTISGSGAGSFTANITGLASGTQYYARAYATNSAGTAYGSEVAFSTPGAGLLPIISTMPITDITNTGASSGVMISSEGASTVQEYGLEWNIVPNNQWDTDWYAYQCDWDCDYSWDPGTTGEFPFDMSWLDPGVTYYVRAYAQNSYGVAFGEEITFTTTTDGLPAVTTAAVTDITTTGALSGGNVTDEGSSAVTEYGLVWNFTPIDLGDPCAYNCNSNWANVSGSFEFSMDWLEPGITYYVRAYARNDAGVAYGNEVTFTTEAVSSGLPVVVTKPVADINFTAATAEGEVTDQGGSAITEYGIEWNTEPNSVWCWNDCSDNYGEPSGTFSSEMYNLTPNTTYYVRAFASNDAGRAFGNEVIFKTGNIFTTPVTNIGATGATSGGSVDGDGSGIAAYELDWNTLPNYYGDDYNYDYDYGALPGGNSFSFNMSSLLPDTTYYAQAIVADSNWNWYQGEWVSFRTLPPSLPTVVTAAISNMEPGYAESGFTITNSGGAVAECGIVWSQWDSPPTLDNNVSVINVCEENNPYVMGFALAPDETYHLRAVASNSAGTAYGDEITFVSPSLTAPVVTSTAAISDITSTTATSGGEIAGDGGSAVTDHGVVWSTNPNPTVADGFTSEGPISVQDLVGSASVSFTSILANLLPETTYYVRAYATNAGVGTAYGDELSFTTGIPGAPALANAIPEQGATIERNYSFSFSANTFIDASSYTADLPDGSPLPAWLSFNPVSRTFSGHPTKDNVGAWIVRVTAHGFAGQTLSTTFALEADYFPTDDGTRGSCGGECYISYIGVWGEMRSTCNACNTKGYIRWDTTGWPTNVSQVSFRFTHSAHTTYCYSNCSGNFYIYPVTSSWSEGDLCSAEPTVGTAIAGPYVISFPNDFGTVNYDITATYNNWVSTGQDNGIAFWSPDGWCNNAGVIFGGYSREESVVSRRPRLVIVE